MRLMKAEDVDEVSRIVIESFSDSVAEGLTKRGIETFSALSSPEAFGDRLKQDNEMFVYEEQGHIAGMIELKEGRHIAMLFISPEHQRKGVGQRLMQAALERRRVETVTVSASLPSVSAYRSYGFEVVGPESELGGLRYIPMEIDVSEFSGLGEEIIR